MSRIKKKGESIQRKLEDDSKPEEQKDVKPECPNDIKTERQNVDKPEKHISDKEKVTFYLPRETTAKFNEVCAKKMMRNEKMNRSELICKAIDLLWKEEKTYEI